MSGHTRQHGVLTTWLTPMRAASGPMRNLGLGWSYLVHLAGTGLFLLAILFYNLIFWQEDLLWVIRYELDHNLVIALLAISLWIVVFELAFLILAFLTTCWGAGVEGFTQSYSRSLSRWYQLTPWLALIVLGLWLAFIGIDTIESSYWDHYSYARYGDYYDNHNEPFQLLNYDRFELLLTIGRLGSLGIANLLALWWVLGTVAVHRIKPTWPASCRWPAVCEGCGYALAGMTDEQGCPECGKSIASSKYTHRGTRDLESIRMLMRGLFQPRAVGAAMLTRRPTKMPLRVLLWGLLFTVLSGPVFMVTVDTTVRITDGYGAVDDFGDAIEFYLAIGLTVGVYTALVGSFLLLGAGTLVATIVRIMGKRNIMPAACKAACYSAALLPIWVLAQAVQLMILIPLGNYLGNQGQYDLLYFFPFLVLLMHAAILLYLILHIARITKAARHANV